MRISDWVQTCALPICLEVHDASPELLAEKQYRHRRDLSGLDQRQQFKRFVECTEPARKHRHRPRAQQEMQLAKREKEELQAERRRDERVRQLLVRERDVQTAGRSAGIISAGIRGFNSSDERRGGKECGRTFGTEGARDQSKKN